MLAKLNFFQLAVLFAITVIWGIVFLWIWIRKIKPQTHDDFARFIEWRKYRNNPHGTVGEWSESTTEQMGPIPARLNRTELTIAWTAFAGMIASWLLFEWTKTT